MGAAHLTNNSTSESMKIVNPYGDPSLPSPLGDGLCSMREARLGAAWRHLQAREVAPQLHAHRDRLRACCKDTATGVNKGNHFQYLLSKS